MRRKFRVPNTDCQSTFRWSVTDNRDRSTFVPGFDRKVGQIILLLTHILISGGIVMAAIGGSNIYSDASNSSKLSTDRTLMKAGYLILLVAVILLTTHAVFTLHRLRSVLFKGSATTLLYWVLAAMPFIAVRVIYSVVYAFTLSASLSPLTGTFAVKFILIFLVQFIAACCLIIGGFKTRHIEEDMRTIRDEEIVMPPH
jgi:hypothetical protein